MKQQLKFNRRKRSFNLGGQKWKIFFTDEKKFEELELKKLREKNKKPTEEDIVKIREDIPYGRCDADLREIWINKEIIKQKIRYTFEEIVLHELTHAIGIFLAVKYKNMEHEEYINPFASLFYDIINQLLEQPKRKKKVERI